MLTFDNRGNLKPPEKTVLDFPTFESYFVDKFKTSGTRKRLWKNFTEFSKRIQHEVAPQFSIWVDGSFVSLKIDPRDLDAVFWLDLKFAESKMDILDNRFFTQNTKTRLGLDVFYGIEYPENHKLQFFNEMNQVYWAEIYGHTPCDFAGNQFKKGFVELKIV